MKSKYTAGEAVTCSPAEGSLKMSEIGTKELTYKQQKAITALLTTQTIGQAAALCGVSERQLYRWLDEPIFQAALREAGESVTRSALRRLMAGTDKALDTLHGLMDAENESVKRMSAMNWLDTLYKAKELQELEDRLQAIEKELNL